MLSMWNLFQGLEYTEKRPMIQDGLATIRFIRLLAPTELNSDTTYVAKSEDYFHTGEDSVLIVHRRDMILIPGADVSEVFNQVSNLLEDMIRWDGKLAEYQSDKDGITKMLESCRRYLNGAFYVYAFGGNTLGLVPSRPGNSPFWNAMLQSRDMSYERMDILDQIVDFSELDSDLVPTLREAKNGSILYIHCNIKDHSRIVAHLLYFSFDPQIARGTEVFLDRLSYHITYCFFKHFENINIGDRTAGILLKLCQDKGHIAPDVQNYFRDTNWVLQGDCQCLAVYCGPKNRTIRLTNMVKLCRSVFSKTVVCFLDNYLVALISLQAEKNFKASLKYFLSHITDDFICGISNVFQGLEKTHLYSRQAILEAERCEQLEVNISHGNRHDIDYFHSMFTNTPMGECYINRSLLQLATYDRNNGTDYYITLKAYLMSFFHISDAARMLDVHRNTFIYRISRIRELIDFSEFDQAIHNYDMDKLSSYQLSIFYIDQMYFPR